MSTTTYCFVEKKETNISSFLLKNGPYLELCSTFNIKTAPGPCLGNTKGGLNSDILLYMSSNICEMRTFKSYCASTRQLFLILWKDVFACRTWGLLL